MDDGAPRRDSEYLKGLGEAVARGVEYGIKLVASGEHRVPSAPLPLIGQARLAAREGISLDLVLRRYLAGKMLLSDFLLQEATRIDLHDPVLIRNALATYAGALDRVLTMATEEYDRELEARLQSPESRLAQRVQRLLNAEPVDCSLLEYDLERHHLGLVALAPDVRPVFRQMGRELDVQVLSVVISDLETWAWIGASQPLDPQEIVHWAAQEWPASAPLGIGEPGQASPGWRRTHGQAKAAARLAAQVPDGQFRYRDVALVASVSSDPLLLASLHDMYLQPLGSGKRGDVLRRTLLVYFRTERNTSSSASALEVSRQTVAKRLEVAEERLMQPLSQCGDALHAALRLERLGYLSAS